jgi:hypothetical protein
VTIGNLEMTTGSSVTGDTDLPVKPGMEYQILATYFSKKGNYASVDIDFTLTDPGDAVSSSAATMYHVVWWWRCIVVATS